MMVTVKATHIVRPAEPTPEEIMYLHASDQIKDYSHTTTIYFYKHSTTDAISRLKDSLSKALVQFYPLAGRLSWAPEGGERVELHCNGKGVPIFEAMSEASVEDFGHDFSPTPAMQDYIPSWNYTAPIDDMPLVIVQLTKFRCGGVSIGLGCSHILSDGPSSLHFVDEWAKISRGAEPVAPPYLDRRVLDTDQPLLSAFDPSALSPMPTLLGEEDNTEQRKSPIAAAVLKLTILELEKLRGKANLDGSTYTRFEAVAAHIWRCTSKARGHAAEQQTGLLFVADFRNKLNPPLPKHFFGNALIRVKATDKSGSLLSNSVGAVAKKIREAKLKSVSDGTVRAYLDYLKGLPDVGPFRTMDNRGRAKGYTLKNPNLGIVSWTAMPLYGTDFGWGKEIHMGPGPNGFDGKFLILPAHDGDDAWNIFTWLQEQHMPDFKKCFYDDIS